MNKQQLIDMSDTTFTNTVIQCSTKVELFDKFDIPSNGTFHRIINEKISRLKISLKPRKSKWETLTKNCPICLKEFDTTSNPKEERTTCSYSCSNSFFRSGENNPNWKQGSYRSTCFSQHDKKCIICGEDKIVEVHHYDNNHNNNSIENLIPICPTHHKYIHSRYYHLIKNDVDNYWSEWSESN